MIENSQPSMPDQEISSLKIPPHSIEAEQSVLGGLMLDELAWDRVAEAVAEVDFYRAEHRLIFREMAKIVNDSQPIDVITLSEALQRNGELDKVGGLAYLGELAKNVPSAANITHYAKIVRERAILRQLIGAANQIADSAFNTAGRTSAEILDNAERQVFDISESRAKESGPVVIKPILKKNRLNALRPCLNQRMTLQESALA